MPIGRLRSVALVCGSVQRAARPCAGAAGLLQWRPDRTDLYQLHRIDPVVRSPVRSARCRAGARDVVTGGVVWAAGCLRWAGEASAGCR